MAWIRVRGVLAIAAAAALVSHAGAATAATWGPWSDPFPDCRFGIAPRLSFPGAGGPGLLTGCRRVAVLGPGGTIRSILPETPASGRFVVKAVGDRSERAVYALRTDSEVASFGFGPADGRVRRVQRIARRGMRSSNIWDLVGNGRGAAAALVAFGRPPNSVLVRDSIPDALALYVRRPGGSFRSRTSVPPGPAAAIAIGPQGDVLVTWAHAGVIRARAFDRHGTARRTARLGRYDIGARITLRPSLGTGGRAVVAWSSVGEVGSGAALWSVSATSARSGLRFGRPTVLDGGEGYSGDVSAHVRGRSADVIWATPTGVRAGVLSAGRLAAPPALIAENAAPESVAFGPGGSVLVAGRANSGAHVATVLRRPGSARFDPSETALAAERFWQLDGVVAALTPDGETALVSTAENCVESSGCGVRIRLAVRALR